ncbi:MAG TPA: amidohydrolase family protein [Pyrinomonadaceae bacterium]|nr:amidohydrolase family protein [Pyrinomonadaceae bacterium]
MFPRLPFILLFSLLASISPPLSRSQTTAPKPHLGARQTISIRVKEGTTLGFDFSPNKRSIVFDLLGQLWLIPAQGGEARSITNAVRDSAEDLDPSFSPDGRRVVFRGERNGRTGLWLLDLDSKSTRQLTQLPNPEGFEGNASWSPDGRMIAFARAVPDFANKRWRSDVLLLDVASGTIRELSIAGTQNPQVRDPVWVRAGRGIAFVARNARGKAGGPVWIVAAGGGQAIPVTGDSVEALAPAFTADGRRLAYFAPDSSGRMQVWVQQITAEDSAAGPPLQVTNHADVTPTRIRWIRDGNALLYSADGRLWQAAASGGQPREIPFTAELSFTRPRRALPPAHFPEPGRQEPARGFMGLALSPDGHRIGMLALGKLWIIPVAGSPRAVTEVPFAATSLAWSPDGTEVAWSSGIANQADLFATNLTTGATRQVTSLPGRELYPAYSPDGRHLAFVHAQDDGGVLRVVEAKGGNVGVIGQNRDLGSIGLNWTSPPQWSPESDGLLVSGEANPTQPASATFVPLSGQRQAVTRFPDAPIFLHWTTQHTIVFVRHDRLWRAPFDHTGMLAEPKSLGSDAALYASSARDGTLLFVSEGGLRLRSPDGKEQKVGWPISFTPPMGETTLIRNVRIFDGSGGAITTPRDILIERGRIARIAPAGRLAAGGAKVIDAAGRVTIPGLLDLHAHVYRPELLPGFLYFGITTVRDQGSSMAPLVSYADAFAAGVLPGPRVGYGGFQFYSDWAFDEEQGRGIEPEADPEHIRRSVALAEAFGAQHIKTRTFRRWDINARMITEAHRRGMRATGHCAHLLPLVASGMDAKEHAGLCETRGDTYMYDDLVQLFRAADIGVVPTITYLDFAVRVNERPALLEEDADLAPFLPSRDHFNWMINLRDRQEWSRDAQRWRETTVKLLRAGVTIGSGTDIWQIPIGVHMELEQLVAAGLTPAQAIHAATAGAARILGADKNLGAIQVGKVADLVLLDADPLADIRNTRRIWQVVHNGRVIDRPAILKVVKPR